MNNALRKITRINKGFSNSLHIPYSLVELECKHKPCSVPLKNNLGSAHDESNWNLPESMEMECLDCARNIEAMAGLPELLSRTAYTRFRRVVGRSTVHFYGTDKTSPSGVVLIASMEHTAELENAIRAFDSRKTPLSPTEMLCAPSRGNW